MNGPRLGRRVLLALPLLPASAAAAPWDALLAGRVPQGSGPLRLDIPSIAENGLVVPLTVEVDSPMTAADHVTAVHIFAEANPTPHVASFRFTPDSGRASVVARIRLAQSQTVTAIAETSTGGLYRAASLVKVTIGGCGG